MKNSDILRRAKGQVEEREYVCLAINYILLCNKEELALRKWVLSLMDGFGELDSWLESRGVVLGEAPDRTAKLLATRLAWIDWMIQYWEARGE